MSGSGPTSQQDKKKMKKNCTERIPFLEPQQEKSHLYVIQADIVTVALTFVLYQSL